MHDHSSTARAMAIIRRGACSIALALLAFTLISASVSAHAVQDPSPVHGILDSGVVPAIAGGVVLALTVVWYRVQRGRTR